MDLDLKLAIFLARNSTIDAHMFCLSLINFSRKVVSIRSLEVENNIFFANVNTLDLKKKRILLFDQNTYLHDENCLFDITTKNNYRISISKIPRKNRYKVTLIENTEKLYDVLGKEVNFKSARPDIIHKGKYVHINDSIHISGGYTHRYSLLTGDVLLGRKEKTDMVLYYTKEELKDYNYDSKKCYFVKSKTYSKNKYVNTWRTSRGSSLLPSFDHKIKRMLGISSPTFIKTNGMKYTFGVELETSKGHLPMHIEQKYNVKCVRDMSITSRPDLKTNAGEYVRDYCGSGGEYVTGVLTGDTGLTHLTNLINDLNKTCSSNESCSVHIHIGSKFTKKDIIAMYKVFQMIEEEMYQMNPEYKRKSLYSRPMKKLSINAPFVKQNSDEFRIWEIQTFANIFNTISGKDYPLGRNLTRRSSHPRGAKLGYDKRTPRYWWINFVPTLFAFSSTNTIEFRIHENSLDSERICNWLLTCMSTIKYCQENYAEIVHRETLSLSQIFDKTLNKENSKRLKKYVIFMKNSFVKVKPKEVEMPF